MKTLFTFLMLTTGFCAMAQQILSSKEVVNDGRQLRIRVDVDQPGRSVHYSRSFDISAMDKQAVQALETRVLDSLKQVSGDRYTDWSDENRRNSRYKKKPADSDIDENDDRDGGAVASSAKPLSSDEVAPSSVLFRDDKENGRLWMQYIFHKNGEELVVERTANVAGKTERDKQAIIKETERSLGIKSLNQ